VWIDDDQAELERELKAVRTERAALAKWTRADQLTRSAILTVSAVLIAGGAAEWVRGAGTLGAFLLACAVGLASTNYVNAGWLWLLRLPFARRIASSWEDRSRRRWDQILVPAPTAVTHADYGPNGQQVGRLISLVETLTSRQWERLWVVGVRFLEKQIVQLRERRDRDLATREAVLERQIARRREAPWDGLAFGESEATGTAMTRAAGHLPALGTVAGIRVDGQHPPQAAMIVVRRAVRALVDRGAIDEAEFVAEYEPFRRALGPVADEVIQ
jgi:hypothetical protein